MTTETSGGTDADVLDAIETIGSDTAENSVWAAVIITGTVVLASIVRQTVARLINGDELVGDLVGRLASYTIVPSASSMASIGLVCRSARCWVRSASSASVWSSP
jgi:hypothetical protein